MIYEVLRKVIVDELGVEDSKFDPSAYIEKDLELDSTETVAVALALKKNFNVEYLFPKEDVRIQDVVQSVESKISVNNKN